MSWQTLAMSPPGRPKGEYRSAQHEGTPVGTRAERRAALVQRPMAFVPSKSAQADSEPRHSAPKPARARRETWPALVASKPAQAGSEPRHSLPSGDRSMYSSNEGSQ